MAKILNMDTASKPYLRKGNSLKITYSYFILAWIGHISMLVYKAMILKHNFTVFSNL